MCVCVCVWFEYLPTTTLCYFILYLEIRFERWKLSLKILLHYYYYLCSATTSFLLSIQRRKMKEETTEQNIYIYMHNA